MFHESPFGLADSEIRSSIAPDCKSVAAIDCFFRGRPHGERKGRYDPLSGIFNAVSWRFQRLIWCFSAKVFSALHEDLWPFVGVMAIEI